MVCKNISLDIKKKYNDIQQNATYKFKIHAQRILIYVLQKNTD